jgi:hypothetical protein
MANEPNSGYVKNVTAFKNLLEACTSHGDTYNPAREALQLNNLNALFQSVTDTLAECTSREIAYDNLVDARIMTFKDLKPLATKVIGTLNSSGVSSQIKEAARTINHKVQGSRPTAKVSPDGEASESRRVSSSKQGFDEKISEFAKLIELVKSQPEYKPNEPTLQVIGLQGYLSSLSAAQDAVGKANVSWHNSRVQRDKLMYAPDTGLVDIALAVKEYLKGIFGASSPEFKLAKGFAFKTLA